MNDDEEEEEEDDDEEEDGDDDDDMMMMMMMMMMVMVAMVVVVVLLVLVLALCPWPPPVDLDTIVTTVYRPSLVRRHHLKTLFRPSPPPIDLATTITTVYRPTPLGCEAVGSCTVPIWGGGKQWRLCEGGGNGVCSTTKGRLEMFHAEEWRPLCTELWDTWPNLLVACKMFGFQHSVAMAEFGGYTGDHWVDDLVCTGSEENLLQCEFDGFDETCADEIGIICTNQHKPPFTAYSKSSEKIKIELFNKSEDAPNQRQIDYNSEKRDQSTTARETKCMSLAFN
ncbi:L3BPB-like protein [Mya arenaria]|uniref:L3BPB-like protein n=1 Tax=Mya arenaria TaxID=6604 RepID=A0ABY7F785_MYAAR|nr:L3BPB-like protein [Mya arenaria]